MRAGGVIWALMAAAGVVLPAAAGEAAAGMAGVAWAWQPGEAGAAAKEKAGEKAREKGREGGADGGGGAGGGGGGAGVLGGPRVGEEEGGFRVRLTLEGRVRRGEGRPEEEVVRSMGLGAEALAAVARVFEARGVILERFVVTNLDLLTRLNSAGGAGDTAAVFGLGWEAVSKLSAMGMAWRLEEEVERALPEEKRGEFRRLMRDYWRAAGRERAANEGGGALARAGGEFAERVELLGQEIARAFERADRSGDLAFYYLMSDLSLSDRQRVKLRGMFADYAAAGGEDAPESVKATFFIGVVAHLSAEQRERLFARLRALGVLPALPEGMDGVEVEGNGGGG
ncbi:MAG: hypothetical protein HRU70_06650 [Phycisphaeraceae bacterium]|nr:MAG: hypothetical protein HRU70_06650 [Phycisphaeraceae bacterium]